MEKRQLLNQLLDNLTAHLQVRVSYGTDYASDRRLFRGLCNQCLTLDGMDKNFYVWQDELLSRERDEKGVVDVNTLPFVNGIALFKGDITTLQADAIVNAANDQYLGCFEPNHSCIDNIIMSAAGFQMRNELLQLKQQPNYDRQPVKVTKGYNLPCRYVFHVAGPQIADAVTAQDQQALADCYLAALNQAQTMGLGTLVFCCISTGLYAFPHELACEIAVSTVKKWLDKNQSPLKIIFNVFQDVDEELYAKRLR